MTEVNERLSLSKEGYVTKQFEVGVDLGRQWAEHKATYCDLLLVRKIRLVEDLGDNYVGAFETLYATLNPDGESDRAEFCQHIFADESQPDDPLVAGFIDGAQDYFDSVKDSL